ncbi:MAG: hypothetical protein GY714_05760 [Desulfobacterales bacterium]|nr:hypothetical protein [Desulfobacterales bacterium]
MKIFLIFVIAIVASMSSFVVHIATVDWLPVWIGNQMQGINIQPSWSVRYVAAVTSVEYGLAGIVLYSLAREKLLVFGTFKTAIIFSILLASIHGAFVRQPLMDYLVGNPMHVALVQNAFKWLIWLIMSFVIVYGYEFIVKRNRC